ncbi:MAG: glycerol-3-phosphate 1-O-acyltransferase PlsY [Armatimonadota bacterium]|nr:glycerol-3-phosphate 1-O-acyltransferase PlsY [Armatimonadota bacterium]
MKTAAAFVACYLLGAVPIGLLVGKVYGIDIRRHGSGNIGASNVLRMLGRGPAAVVFVGDTLKGLLAVRICMALFPHDPLLVVAGGLLCVFGHNCSVFLRFQGGKGVATSLGVVIGIHPLIAAITFALWVSLVGIWRYISVASIVASISVSVQMWLSDVIFDRPVPREYLAFAIAAALFILIKHRSNVARLRAGCEPKFGQKS